MGRVSRDKGARFEREIANMFVEWGIRARRNLEEVRSGNRGDLEFPDGEGLAVQLKVGENPSVWKAIQEAVEAAGPDDLPIAIVRRNQRGSRPKQDIAVLRLEDLLDLIALTF